ncbi:MAG: glycosyltransferase family 4 protein [Pseudolabrys sp.]
MVGGIAQYNSDFVTALAQSSHVETVTVLTRFGTAPSRSHAKVTQLAPSRRRVLWSARAVALALRQRFDVVFCGHLNAAPLAYGIAKFSSSRLWLQVHGYEGWTEPNMAVRCATERANLITAVSRYTRQRLLGWANIEPSGIRVLPNTVTKDHTPRVRRPDLIKRYGLEGRKVILTVSRIASAERYKGHDRIITALPDVAARCPEAVYLIVGSGDDVPRLESEALSKGVAERVIFAGHVPAGELPHYFALADVFAMPSTGEGFGIVFLQAARCGVPVIGGNQDGSVDALADGQIGRLIDPSDARQLADALASALDHSQRTPVPSVERFCFENFARHVDDLVGGLN